MTKEDLQLIIEWFAHIEQIADDRKTANGAVMEDWAALDEIRCKSKDCKEYIKLHCLEPSLPSNLDEAAEEYMLEDNEDAITSHQEYLIKSSFKAGAEWMARQGVTFEDTVTDDEYMGYTLADTIWDKNVLTNKFNDGDEVIVQIRKK